MVDTTTSVPVSSEAAEEAMDALKKQASFAEEYYSKLASQVKETLKENNMAEILQPSGMMMSGNSDGVFGGGGLIGGLILGSLLRNNGNLLGGEGGAGGAMLRSPPEQSAANMALMQSIGAVDKAVAVSTAAFEASQATQSLGLTNQFNNQTTAIFGTLNSLGQNIMENRYELSKDISSDGDKTRALITQQYEATLNRQLGEANAALIELRTQNLLAERTRGVEVTTTNNINQMQQQQQQQSRDSQLYNAIWGLGQSIRDSNSAINVGSGTQTSTNTPTNTNIR